MSTTYLNLRTSYGVETVDQIDLKDFSDDDIMDKYTAYRKAINELKLEYHIAGMPVYRSSRPASNWK